jgi:hypothetical protein
VTKKIIVWIGVVFNALNLLSITIGYVAAPDAAKLTIIKVGIMFVALVCAGSYMAIAVWLLRKPAPDKTPTTSAGASSDSHISALKAAEQRIADLERKLSELETVKEATLPALRPRIAPVKWGRAPDNRCGLFVRNDGESAFDISVEEPVLIGKAKLQFWDRVYSGLTKADGEMLMEAHIETATGYGLAASGLRDEMLKAEMDVVTLKIKYGDIDGQKWMTSCDVVREFWGTGMRISGVRQERAV